MKKVVRMLGLCALMALAVSACKKNDDTNKVTFKATICQPKDDSRTHIENINAFGFKGLFWDANNEIKVIKINSGDEESFVTESTKIDGQDATFEGTGAFLSDIYTPGEYSAFYPNSNFNGNNVFMTIPNVQNFEWETFADNLYPMYGLNELDSDGEPVFNFHSDCGVLRLQFKLDLLTYGEDAEIALDKIVVTAPADVLAGTMKYQHNGNYKGIDTNYPMFDEVELNCAGTNMVSNRWTDFYIVLPAGALSTGFNVTIYSANGTSVSYQAEAGHAIAAETITWMPQVNIMGDL